jgi:tRNA 2-thiouridine synthesizing protein A
MEREPDQSIDLRGTPCPLNWVKTKLRLEEMETGQLLEVFIDDGEPMRNVPKSIKSEGHNIVDAGPTDDGFRLVVERVEDDAP